MTKYLFLALYAIVAIHLYRTFLNTLDSVKASYEEKYKDKLGVTKKTYFAFCDFTYCFYMILWPICLIDILIRMKKGKKYVHKGQNSGGDGEGPHQD